MRITRGDQIEIGDRVLINGEPFIAYHTSALGTALRGDHPEYTHRDFSIPFTWQQSMQPDLCIKLNTNLAASPVQKDPVKVENESGKKVQIEKVGEVMKITIY